jgi:hypothetical protein
MDQEGLDLVARRLADRLRQINQVLTVGSHARGSSLLHIVREIAHGIERQRDEIVAAFGAASVAERRVLGRKMLRLSGISEVLGWLTPFISDVGKQDVPLGLLQMIDALIGSLLPGGADPVIHLDARYMYSTLDILNAVEPTLTALGIATKPRVRPVIFFLPAGDPTNALLMPILAHEIGHAAVARNHLGSAVLQRVDAPKLNALFSTCLAKAKGPDPREWQMHLFQWVDELICDALATVLCGPSMLFASAAFLPASNPGSFGTHPHPAERIRVCIEQLSTLGWESVLATSCPKTLQWLRNLQLPPPSVDPREEFLRGSIALLEAPLLEVAVASASGALTPSAFQGVSDKLQEFIGAKIPPAQVSGDPTDPWAITLAAWLHQFNSHGDAVETLAVAASDRHFNDFVQKSIELARIVRLWRES